MFASGPAIVSVLFLLQAETQFETGARVEGRVGVAPTGIQTNSLGQTVAAEQAQVMVLATPILGLHWLDDTDELRASSATRILWRPVPLWGDRPLFLETVEATHVKRPSRRSRWQLSILGSYGEQDYTSLQQQLVNQPTLPAAATMLAINTIADASWRSSRRTTLTLQLGATHRRSFNTMTAGSGPAFFFLPTQTAVTVAPGLRHALSRRSSLEAVASVMDTDLRDIPLGTSNTGQLNVLSIQPQIGVRQELTRQQQLHLAAGFTYAVALRRTDQTQTWHPISPLLQIDLSSILRQTRAAVVRSMLSAGTMWYTDPVLGVSVWRGIGQALLDAELGPRWSAGARCTFTTDLTGLKSNGGVTPDETLVSAEIPVRYRWSKQLLAEFGARYAERGPRMSLALHNPEAWLFLTLLTTPRASPTKVVSN